MSITKENRLLAAVLCVIAIYGMADMASRYIWAYWGVLGGGPDRIGYMAAADHVFSRLADIWRTPVYPMIMKVTQVVCGAWWQSALMTLQWALLIVSAAYLWRICRMMGVRMAVTAAATLLYGLSPCVNEYCHCMLAEPWSLAVMIFLIYHILRFNRERVWRYAVAASALLVVLTFLKPVFVFMIPIMAVVWGYMVWRSRQGRSPACVALVVSMAVGGAGWLYSGAVKDLLGVRTMTLATISNANIIMGINSVWQPSEITDPEVKALWQRVVADNGFDPNDGTFDTTTGYRMVEAAIAADILPEYYSQMQQCSSRHRALMLRAYLHNAAAYCTNSMAASGEASAYRRVAEAVSLPLWPALLIVVAYAVAVAVTMVRRRRLMGEHLLLVTVPLSMALITIVGSMDEYGRLMAPAYPCLAVIAARGVSTLMQSRRPAEHD